MSIVKGRDGMAKELLPNLIVAIIYFVETISLDLVKLYRHRFVGAILCHRKCRPTALTQILTMNEVHRTKYESNFK